MHAYLAKIGESHPPPISFCIMFAERKDITNQMVKLVLIRHGQSQWNLENKFTGWTDVDLSPKGEEEAKAAGEALRKGGYDFDVVYTSVLKRANRTMDIALNALYEGHVPDGLPKHYSWRLNERHYGALQGLNKAESAVKWGDEQVHIWRRSADVPPPALTKDDERWPGNQELYTKKLGLSEKECPLTECLLDTCDRVEPIFEGEIKPLIKEGKRVLIVAHGNSLRALVKELEGLSNEEIIGVEIPTGKPLVYELDEKTLKVLNKYYL